MTTEDVWSAVADLAEAWTQTPRVQALNAIAVTGAPTVSAIARALQELDAGGATITYRPLAIATELQYGLAAQPHVAKDVSREDLSDFMSLAEQVEVAHIATVAWIRSRLPGYPMINAPQLVRDSSWTTEQWTHRYPWRRADRGAGLQYQSRVDAIGALLGSAEDFRLADLTTILSNTLKQTREWLAFGAAGALLTPSDKEQLKAACVDLRSLLVPEVIDRHEPNLAVPRAQYREYQTREVVDAMAGRAGEYARALWAINEVVDLVAVDVLAQLTRFGRPVAVEPFSVAFDEAGENRITADLIDDMRTMFIKPGRLVHLVNPLTPDVIRVESASFSMNDGTARIRIRGRTLADSGLLSTRITLGG